MTFLVPSMVFLVVVCQCLQVSLLEECSLMERALQELHKKESKIVSVHFTFAVQHVMFNAML